MQIPIFYCKVPIGIITFDIACCIFCRDKMALKYVSLTIIDFMCLRMVIKRYKSQSFDNIASKKAILNFYIKL